GPGTGAGTHRRALSLLLGLLDALAVGERVLDGGELRECLAALGLHAASELRIAGAASREVRVAAGGPDRVHDATERARLLGLLLCRQRLYTGVTQPRYCDALPRTASK